MTGFICPICCHENDAATEPDDPNAIPKAGDVSICINCAGISTFTGNGLEARHPTDDELVRFVNDPKVRKMQAAVTIMRMRGEL